MVKKRWRVRKKQKSIPPRQMTNYSFSLNHLWILKASASFKEKVGNQKYIYILYIYIHIYIYIYIHVYIWKDFGYYVKTIPRRSTKTSKQRVTYLEDLVAAELKTIRTNGLQKSCDNRKNSRGGRIVFTFYGLCENLLGGYPAVTSLPNAIDSPLQD